MASQSDPHPVSPPSSEDSDDLAQRLRRYASWTAAQLQGFAGWARRNPGPFILLIGLFATLGYFYFGVKAFQALTQSPAQWMAAGWNAENDQEHCWFLIPGAILIIALRWYDIKSAPKTPSNLGLLFVGAGVLAYVVGIRCVEARYTIVALPLLIFGSVLFLYGRAVARMVGFPCLFLLLMIPIGGVIQSTVPLQVFTAKILKTLSSLCGVHVQISGANLISTDGRFEPMEVAGGCSGIRSLMAMVTLAALYGYYAMRTPLRGMILFASSIIFAIFGNIVRVFTVVLFANFIDPKKALDIYHDASGFVFFPAAVFAMVTVGRFINSDWEGWWKRMTSGAAAPAAAVKPSEEKKSSGPISYDY